MPSGLRTKVDAPLVRSFAMSRKANSLAGSTQGSPVFRLLLRVRRVFVWIAPMLVLALVIAGAASAFFAWQKADLLLGSVSLLAFAVAVVLGVLWSEYDWWLFKLGPRDSVDIPFE